MKVQVWNYLKEYKNLELEIISAVKEVFSSGRLILGDNVAKFEEEYSRFCDAQYAVGVNSGTDALFIALKALGIEQNDEVISVSNTAVPTISAIVSSGAIPKFVDVDKETYLMDISQIEYVISERTRCILPVHLYGQCVDMDDLIKIAEKHDIKILEDCAQSSGARYKNKKSGSIGNISAHSFYPTKNLGAYGDAGMIVTSDESLYQKARSLRMYGMDGTYYSNMHGYNSRLDEIQAAILLVKLKYLEEWIERRREISKIYEQRLSSTSLIFPKEMSDNYHSYYVYVVQHDDRDKILEELKKRNIFCNISYPYPIHLMKGYEYLGVKECELPNTEYLSKRIFSLPMYPTLENEEVEYVCENLLEILNE